MEYVYLQLYSRQYNRMHVKVAILVLVQATDLNTSDTVAVLCPTDKIYPYFPVKIVNRDKTPRI